jgi:hypothetical protein
MTMTRTQALKTARAQVGQLYRTGKGQYTYNSYDDYRDAWMMGGSLPYAAARRSRSDAIKCRALELSGVDYDDAYRAVYG